MRTTITHSKPLSLSLSLLYLAHFIFSYYYKYYIIIIVQTLWHYEYVSPVVAHGGARIYYPDTADPCFPFTCENSVCNAETKQCDCDEGYLHDFSGLQCIKAPADGKLYPLCSGDDVSACGIEVNDDGATISPSVFGSQVTCCPKGSTGYLDKDGTQKCSAPCGAGEGGAGSASSTEPAEGT